MKFARVVLDYNYLALPNIWPWSEDEPDKYADYAPLGAFIMPVFHYNPVPAIEDYYFELVNKYGEWGNDGIQQSEET